MYRHLRNIAVSALLLVSCAAAQALISAPAPSITAGERFKDYFDRTYGWEQMGQIAFSTGVDFLIVRPEWGRGVGGFSCGYASAFGARVVTNSAEFGAASALREDIRFRPSQRKGIVPRLKFAAAHAFMAYDGDNKVEPGYARFIGITGGALVEPAWHAGGLTAARFGKNVGFRSLDQVEQSVLTEFSPDLKRLSQRVRNKLLNK